MAGALPFTAMLLWQAIALAGGLSMIGAMLVYGLEPIGDNLIAGLRALAEMVLFNAPTTALGFWHIFALSAAALLTAHLVFTLLLTYYRIERQRRRTASSWRCWPPPPLKVPGRWSSAMTRRWPTAFLAGPVRSPCFRTASWQPWNPTSCGQS